MVHFRISEEIFKEIIFNHSHRKKTRQNSQTKCDGYIAHWHFNDALISNFGVNVPKHITKADVIQLDLLGSGLKNLVLSWPICLV